MGFTIMLQIAIDGPVAAGKGTVAKKLAERLGILYVDTGAMYRVGALLATRAGVALHDEVRVAKLLQDAVIEMRNPVGAEVDGRQSTVFVNGEDVSWEIRTETMSQGSSSVARHKKVREVLVQKQQVIAQAQPVVMEGRDITYRVLPQATLKVFLTADETERAERRLKQLLERGVETTLEAVLVDLKQRDKQDMERAVDPLRIEPDAYVLNTTNKSVDAVVQEIIAQLSEEHGKARG